MFCQFADAMTQRDEQTRVSPLDHDTALVTAPGPTPCQSGIVTAGSMFLSLTGALDTNGRSTNITNRVSADFDWHLGPT